MTREACHKRNLTQRVWFPVNHLPDSQERWRPEACNQSEEPKHCYIVLIGIINDVNIDLMLSDIKIFEGGEKSAKTAKILSHETFQLYGATCINVLPWNSGVCHLYSLYRYPIHI